MAVDCRKYPRVRINANVTVVPVAPRSIMGRTLDLSQGGIRLECIDLEAVVGELVHVNLDLNGQRASIIGKVVRITAMDSFVREIALAFVEMDPETSQLLEEYVEGADGPEPTW